MFFNNKSIEVIFDEVSLSLDSVQTFRVDIKIFFLEFYLKKSDYNILFNLRSNFKTAHDLFTCPHFLNCKNKIVSCK